MPAYTIFLDRTLRELVAKRPRDRSALLTVWGLGDARVNHLGDELLALINADED